MSLDSTKRIEIVKALKLGMPIRNVADYVRLELTVIETAMAQDREFRAEANQAVADCMFRHLAKLDKLENWQAIAFILQSLWPQRFGSKSQGTLEGLETALRVGDADPSRLTDEETRNLDALLAKLHGRATLTVTPGVRKCLPDAGGE